MGMFGKSLVGGAFGGQIAPMEAPADNFSAFRQQQPTQQGYAPPKRSFLDRLGLLGDVLTRTPITGSRLQDDEQRAFQQYQMQQRQMQPQQVGNDLVVPDGQGGFKVVYQGQREQAPLEIDRLADAAGIPQDQRSTYYRQALDNKVNPIQAVPYTDESGNSGLQFIRPRSMAPQQQGTPPDVTFTPLQGGAGPQAPRPFR